MNKIILLFILCLALSENTFAQNPAFQVSSTSGGFVAPTMTSAQRTAIASPLAGSLVYQNDGTVGYYYYNGSAWLQLLGGAAVTSITSASPLTTNTSATGAVTVNLVGTVPVANGGTGATTLTTNGILLGNGTSAVSSTAAGTAGQILIGQTGAPTWNTMSNDATISNTGVLTLKNTGTAGTYTKVTTDAQGRVSSGTLLGASDLPGGSSFYIQAQTAVTQSAGFNIIGPGTLQSATLTGISGANVLNFENGSNFTGKNSAGTVEFFLTPRGTDNVTYLNYGSAGFNIRNSSSVSSMFLQNNGNVGIGTTTPTQLLTMGSSTNATTIRFSQRTPNAGGTTIFNVIGNDPANGPYLSWSNTLPLRFSSATDDGGGGWTERMRIDGSTGNVGIGAVSPGALLDLGTAGTRLGVLRMAGNTSGNVTIQPQAIAGTYNFNLPTTAGTSGEVLTSGGGSAAPMTWSGNGAPDRILTFTTGTAATYTVPTGVTRIWIRMVGGGGAGGSANYTGCTGTLHSGCGGGAGGYCESLITSPLASYTYSVGAGGTATSATCGSASGKGGNGGNTTFGTFTASGGVGGVNSNSGIITTGGAGGAASGATINIPGQRGGSGVSTASWSPGDGGSSIFGFGGVSPFKFAAGAWAGQAGQGYGSGGSGAAANAASQLGGAGAGGIIIIYEYK